MTGNINEETPEDVLAKINSETSKIAWAKLLPFFAKGMSIYISHKLDLVDAAYELSQDNKKQIEEWMIDGLIANVSDEQASAWHESNVVVWAVVIKPWVLVQPIVD